MNDEPAFPIRINHYLALQNVASRRQADELIKAGLVMINGKRAVLGDKVNEGDVVDLLASAKEAAAERRYFAYHKARGTALEGSKIKTESKRSTYLFALDRLDRETAGLMIASNDSRAIDMLEHPRFSLSQEFLARVHRPLGNEFFEKVKKGLGIVNKNAKLESIEQTGPLGFKIQLINASVRDVREIASIHRYEITNLVRVGLAGIRLENLKEGNVRELKGKELERFEEAI